MQVLGCVHFPGLSCSGSGSWVLHKATDSVGPAFCALPMSGQFRWPSAWRVHTPQLGQCILPPPPSQPLSFLGCAAGTPSQVWHVSPLGNWSLAVTLLADVDSPGSQEDLVSNCEPGQSLVEDAVSGAKFTHHLPTLAVACLPLCRQQGMGQSKPASCPYTCSVLCSVSGPAVP